MADAAKTVDIIFRGQNQLNPAINSIESSIGGIGDEAAEAEGQVDSLGNQVDDLGGKPKASVDGLAVAFKALAASLIVKDFIDANVAFETFERTMTLVTGSAEAAAEEFEYLQGLTNTLGLEVLSAADNYASLSAATRGTALEGAETKEIFEAVSIAMSSLGKSSADTSGALLAVTQIVSKGTVSMEELRQQLGERIPGAFQIAADSMGLTTAELNDLVATGKLAAEDFLPKFAAGIKAAFGDVEVVDTYTASLNRLKNSVTDAELIIGAGGGFDVLTKVVETGTLAVVGAIAAFEVFGKSIGITVAAIANLDFTNFGEEMAKALEDGAEKTRGARDAFLGLEDAAVDVAAAVDDATGGNDGILWNLEPIQAYSDELDEVAEKTVKTAVELEKIASNERIKNLEFSVDLNIAELEANAKVAVAVVDALGVSIKSSAELLGSLFGDLGDADNLREKFFIEDQIDLENERRAEELKALNKLTDAQARYLNAQAKKINDGGALITVNGDGLKPHLEAIMFDLLESIQVSSNEQGLDLLLGV